MAETRRGRAQVSFTITWEENDRLEAAAGHVGTSLASVMRTALKEFLDRAEQEGKIEVRTR